MPDLKLLARGRTQLSSSLAEELQQGLKAVVTPAGQNQALDVLGIWAAWGCD